MNPITWIKRQRELAAGRESLERQKAERDAIAEAKAKKEQEGRS